MSSMDLVMGEDVLNCLYFYGHVGVFNLNVRALALLGSTVTQALLLHRLCC